MHVHARLIWLLERLCTVLFLFMAIILFVQVVLRYLFADSLFWAEEAARYAMVWLIFLGSVMAACQGAHTRIGFFVDLLPEGPRRYVESGVTLLCALTCAAIAWYGITVVNVAMMSKSPAMRLPLGYVFSAAPICCAVMAVIFLIRAVLQFTGRALPEQVPAEEVEV